MRLALSKKQPVHCQRPDYQRVNSTVFYLYPPTIVKASHHFIDAHVKPVGLDYSDFARYIADGHSFTRRKLVGFGHTSSSEYSFPSAGSG